jgi:elongation factor P
MNSEDYSQYEINLEDFEDLLVYITEDLKGLTALIMDGVLLSVELPQSVDLEIIETAPGIKGATAASRTKPATLTTGLEVQVPEYIETGEVIRVNTGTGKFMSRA